MQICSLFLFLSPYPSQPSRLWKEVISCHLPYPGLFGQNKTNRVRERVAQPGKCPSWGGSSRDWACIWQALQSKLPCAGPGFALLSHKVIGWQEKEVLLWAVGDSGFPLSLQNIFVLFDLREQILKRLKENPLSANWRSLFSASQTGIRSG
jgi:hypothetical protein